MPPTDAAVARPHVLVMNDTHEFLELMEDLLGEEGYRVSTSTWVLAMDRVKALSPDVIVLDVMFEHQDLGWKFLTLSRLDRSVCRIPLVLCTAAVQTVRGMEAHLATVGVGVVLKPFSIDELLRAIEGALHGVPARAQTAGDGLGMAAG